MAGVSHVVFLILIFIAVYVEVFFLLTFFEKRKSIIRREQRITLKHYPTVTIIVPCWNEETTLDKTVQSLLALDYPADKLSIMLVDDGSTDHTWELMQKFATNPRIEIFQKENGGKHTAMNLGISRSTSDYVGCLDADSFVHPQALVRIMTYFDEPVVMAVSPSIIIHEPKTFIQKIQKAEYDWGTYMKKMLAFVSGIHVTPGPFSIYRRKLFDEIGLFRKAHNTEDMEIAFRMQVNHFKIEQCNDAYIYTVGPDSIKKLYKQRLRWIYGFIQNVLDYRSFLFRRKYGTFALFTVPAGIVSVIAVPYMLAWMVYRAVLSTIHAVQKITATGIHLPSFSTHGFSFSVDWFFLNTDAMFLISIVVYILVFSGMIIGRWIAHGKKGVSILMVLLVVVYSFIAPLWILKAIYNTLVGRTTSWR